MVFKHTIGSAKKNYLVKVVPHVYSRAAHEQIEGEISSSGWGTTEQPLTKWPNGKANSKTKTSRMTPT
jgi:hypothetical protein